MGKSSPFTSIINILHFRNANEDLNVIDPVVDPEWVLKKDPDIIFKLEFWNGNNITGETIHSARKDFINRFGYENLKAVQSNRVYFINRDLFFNPRAVIGLVYLAKAIYPNRFTDIDPDAIRREYAQEFGFGDEPGVEWIYPPFEPVNVSSANATARNLAQG
jgi:iron complex transport system substrate-binding protein